MSTSEHGTRGVCETCSGPIYLVVYSVGAEELDEWWAHIIRPADDHEARLAGVSA